MNKPDGGLHVAFSSIDLRAVVLGRKFYQLKSMQDTSIKCVIVGDG